MAPAAAVVETAFRPASVEGGRVKAREAPRLRAPETPVPGRTCRWLLGQIVRVKSTREGHLVLRVRTGDGEIEVLGTSCLLLFEAEIALPTGDVWTHIGSKALIACRREGDSLVIESIAIR